MINYDPKYAYISHSKTKTLGVTHSTIVSIHSNVFAHITTHM